MDPCALQLSPAYYTTSHSLQPHSTETMESKMWSLPLGALKIVGLHPTDNSRIAQIISAIAIIANVAVFVASIAEICVVEWNIVSVAPGVETLMASTQVSITIFVLNIEKY